MPVSRSDRSGVLPLVDLGEAGSSRAVRERYRALDGVRMLVRRTVSPSLLTLDAVLVSSVVALSLLSVLTGAPAASFAAFILMLGYAVPRLLFARRAAALYAVIADEPVTALSTEERAVLPPQFLAPVDARTLAELDGMLRPSTFLVSLRVASAILLCFWVVLLSSIGIFVVSLAVDGPLIVRAAALQVFVAALVPQVAGSLFGWANQRHIDAFFDQADAVLAAGQLPAGDLDSDAAIALTEEGTPRIEPKRLRRRIRPQRRTPRHPPVMPIVVWAMAFLLTVLALAFAFSPAI